MLNVIVSERIPIKIWADDVDEGTLEQAKNLANHPFSVGHVALMPDAHLGYGVPIGSVVAMDGVVVCNAVGSDIGCGMRAQSLNIDTFSRDQLDKIVAIIKKRIPVGFKKRSKCYSEAAFEDPDSCLRICYQERDNARISLGSLGGGNHFLEIQKGSDGHVWVMIHSGSRNLGKKVADYYNGIAVELNRKWASVVPKNHQLAFLPMDADEGRAYWDEMDYCVRFAYMNRSLMMQIVMDSIEFCTGVQPYDAAYDIAHNYASMENHFGKNLVVHRKGATLSREGTIGIIPGSQGTKSYIVNGKGCKESLDSCSHGSGRAMGRKAAQRNLKLEEEIKRLDEQGIIHGIKDVKDLDEAAGAYKDIGRVMENQKDLVEILVELTPLAVIKG